MDSLSQLSAAISNALAGLGPYAPLVGVGAVLLIQWLIKRYGPAPAPVVPSPTPGPATNPLNLAGQFPLLNLLAQALGLVPKNVPATSADIPHDLLVQIDGEVSDMKDAHAAAHTAALADLKPADPPAAAPAAK